MSCPICSGELHAIGHLGRLIWTRCRACGMLVKVGEVDEDKMDEARELLHEEIERREEAGS